MLRQALGTARSSRAASSSTFRRNAYQTSSRRWYSAGTQESKPAAPASQPKPSASPVTTAAWALAGLVVLGAGYKFSSSSSSDSTSGSNASKAPKSGPIPGFLEVANEDAVPVESPVKALDFEAANKKLRENSGSFTFESKDGGKGRVDVVQVASNNPVEDQYAMGVGRGVNGGKMLYAGVYDGHAGWATSVILAKSLIPYVSSALSKLPGTSSSSAIDLAIKKAFVSLDDRLTADSQAALKSGRPVGSPEVMAAIASTAAGSCALLTMFDPKSSVLRTAVTGDSRAVRGSWSPEEGKYTTDVLSKDQTGFNELEYERVSKEHPGEAKDILDKSSGRLLGIAVTRAFGDSHWKWPLELIKQRSIEYGTKPPRPKYKTPPYMTAEPEITTREVRTEDFVILASDGMWDVMSNEHAVECVSRWLAAKKAGNKPEKFEVKTDPEWVMHADEGWKEHKATPENFAIEDMDNAAVCLAKNALGGRRRDMFAGFMTAFTPISRDLRDDITVQVIFFKEP